MVDKNKSSRGPITKGLIYLISPRLLAKPEDVAKYGAFTTRYHKEVLKNISNGLKDLKSAKSNKLAVESFDINDRAARLEVFYDYLYESGVDREKVSVMHANFKKQATGVLIMSLIVMVFSGLTYFNDFKLLIPNVAISIFTFAYGLVLAFKAKQSQYFAWLIEQRLTVDSVSLMQFVKSNPLYWPMSSLSESMLAEVKREYKDRDEMLKNALLDPDFDAAAIGINVDLVNKANSHE